MIDILHSYAYCREDLDKIENYELAVNDDSQRYICHHRLGISEHLTVGELKKLGLYYNRPASELIFLTVKEHAILHQNNLTCEQMREKSERSSKTITKVNKTYWKGRKFSDERKSLHSRIMSEIKWWTNGTNCVRRRDCPGEGWVRGRNGYSPTKGKPMSKEQKSKISATISGKKKWNNGFVNCYSETCPGEGWTRGFIPSSEE